MLYPDNFENKIGFDSVRAILCNKCMSTLGEYHVSDMKFSTKIEDICMQLNATNEFISIIDNNIDFPLNYFIDTTQSLSRIKAEGSYLESNELFDIKRSLSTLYDIISFLKHDAENDNNYPTLFLLLSDLYTYPEIISSIDNVIDKTGNIKDNASDALVNIRHSMQRAYSNITKSLRSIMSNAQSEGILDKDVSPTMRDGRLVIPLSPMHKKKINGIIHDESATGKTIYVEPSQIVELNNAIRELENEERREIIKILTKATNIIRPHISSMLYAYNKMGLIDFIRAKALFAKDINASVPNIEENPIVEWYGAKHPLLMISLREQNKEVVPLNIQLDNINRILIISGPNAGGKSVCLKTVGIIQYMIQCGLPAPLNYNSHVGIFHNLFIDIGDEQSIENDLSTYSSHLMNLKFFINNSNSNSIILIDEFGGGTEPQIGGAIAQAVLHRFVDNQSFGIITTHYQNLKHYAEDTEGLINGAMLYDRHLMQPLFQLSIGNPGSSFAVEIARKIGLPGAVISEAESLVGSDYINMDKYLLDIVRDKRYWERKRQDIRLKEKKIEAVSQNYENKLTEIETEHKAIIKSAKNEASAILDQANASIENTIHEIRKVQADKEKTLQLRKAFTSKKQELLDDTKIESNILKRHKKQSSLPKKDKKQSTVNELSKDPISLGDSVKIEGQSTIGTVLSLSAKNAVVAFGALKTTVDIKRLSKVKATTANHKTQTILITTSDEARERQLNFNTELDIRGMRVDEAIQAVTYFIDDAIQFNINRIRILHGTGTGALRQSIRQYLNTIPQISSYRDEHVQFGGAGITVVTIE